MTLTVLPPDTGEAQSECSFEALMDLAVAEVDAVVGLARKETVHIYRAGQFLSEAQSVLPADQTWGRVLTKYHISRTTAWEAIELFRKASSEEAVSSMSITEAKVHYGIVKAKKPGKAESADQTEAPATLSFPQSVNRPDASEESGHDEDVAYQNELAAEADDDDDAVGEGDPITTEDEWEEPGEMPIPNKKSSFYIGDVIYQVGRRAANITQFTVAKVTETNLLTARRCRFSRDSDLFDSLEEATAKWRSILEERIADLQEELRNGPDVFEKR